MNKKTQKPTALINATPSYQWKERSDYKKENRKELKKSMNVALRILDILDERKMTQQDLADKLKVTRQQISKILKGQENMTFETVEKLEKGLGIELVHVLNDEDKNQTKSTLIRQSKVIAIKKNKFTKRKRKESTGSSQL